MTGPKRTFDWDAAKRLREQGLSYAAIGREFGVTPEAARNAVDDKARELQRAYHAGYQREMRPHLAACPRCGGPAFNRWREGICRACDTERRATSVRDDELRCCLCRQWLPDAEFGPNPRNGQRRGRHIECRPCQAERKRLERLHARQGSA